MTKKTIFMETTEVTAERTAAEISAPLIQSGASQIATDYSNGNIVGLRWTMQVSGGDLLFAMPVRVEPICKFFCQRKKIAPAKALDYSTEIMRKAHRVAWRQLLRWTQAQIAMIECGMTEASEVFLPYWQVDGSQSLHKLLKGREFKALGPGSL